MITHTPLLKQILEYVSVYKMRITHLTSRNNPINRTPQTQLCTQIMKCMFILIGEMYIQKDIDQAKFQWQV